MNECYEQTHREKESNKFYCCCPYRKKHVIQYKDIFVGDSCCAWHRPCQTYAAKNTPEIQKHTLTYISFHLLLIINNFFLQTKILKFGKISLCIAVYLYPQFSFDYFIDPEGSFFQFQILNLPAEYRIYVQMMY